MARKAEFLIQGQSVLVMIYEHLKSLLKKINYMKNQFANDKELLLSALLNKDKINDTYRFDEILDEFF